MLDLKEHSHIIAASIKTARDMDYATCRVGHNWYDEVSVLYFCELSADFSLDFVRDPTAQRIINGRKIAYFVDQQNAPIDDIIRFFEHIKKDDDDHKIMIIN